MDTRAELDSLSELILPSKFESLDLGRYQCRYRPESEGAAETFFISWEEGYHQVQITFSFRNGTELPTQWWERRGGEDIDGPREARDYERNYVLKRLAEVTPLIDTN